MSSQSKRNSLLCPNCRKLISGATPECPFCGTSRPSSKLKNNIFTTGLTNSRQLVTTLIAINVIFFIISILIDPRISSMQFSPFNFLSPSHRSLLVLGSTGSIPLFHLDRWWTLISANYLHGGLLHLLFNMLALRQLAPLAIEEFGSYRVITIYTVGGSLGFLLSAFAGVEFTIGASAAICSLIGALLYYGKSRGGVYGQEVFSQIGSWALGIGFFGFMFPGINNWGHGGGILAGLLLAYLLGYREKRKENMAHKTVAMLCFGLSLMVLSWICLNVLVSFIF
jgi:rhomboid protease GluP